MTRAEDLEMAGEFASTMRGKFILSIALEVAIQQAQDNRLDESDIEDMKYLRKEIYNLPVGHLAPHYKRPASWRTTSEGATTWLGL